MKAQIAMSIAAGVGAILLVARQPAAAEDRPGQTFVISPDHLPPPNATPAAALESVVVPRPSGRSLQAPPGFSVSIFADHLRNPRWLAVAGNGDVFVSEPAAGKVVLLPDNKGKAGRASTFLSGLDKPHGVALHDGYLYVSDVKAVWRVPYKPGQTRAAVPLQRVTKAPDLRPVGNHWTRDFAFGPDGAIYLGLGSRDNVSDFKPGAQIFKIDAGGRMQQFASGLRNAVGLAFYPGTDTLYATVNERDGLGDDLPPDYLTAVKPGGFYGYPYAYIGKHPDPDWGRKRPDLVAKTIVPDVLFQAHSAPNGLVFYTGGNFPPEYRGDAFVSLHGSWNSAKPTGYKVVRVHFQNGKPVNGYQNFVTGFWDGKGGGDTPQRVIGRPAGLALAKDGSLLIADDGGDVIWRVVYRGK